MATFSFDVFGAPLMERDFPLINAAYVDGQFLCTGTTDGTNIGTLKSGAGLYVNFVGVLCAGATTTDGTQSGRNVDEARVIFNPGGVYLCEYDLSTGIAVASVDGTTNAESDPVITVGDGKGHPNLGGGWIYRNVDAGAGELDAVLSSLVSGTANLITLSQVAAALPTTDSYLCPIYPPFTQYGIDITATKIDCTDLDSDG
jgi:hypothetical protein